MAPFRVSLLVSHVFSLWGEKVRNTLMFRGMDHKYAITFKRAAEVISKVKFCGLDTFRFKIYYPL